MAGTTQEITAQCLTMPALEQRMRLKRREIDHGTLQDVWRSDSADLSTTLAALRLAFRCSLSAAFDTLG